MVNQGTAPGHRGAEDGSRGGEVEGNLLTAVETAALAAVTGGYPGCTVTCR